MLLTSRFYAVLKVQLAAESTCYDCRCDTTAEGRWKVSRKLADPYEPPRG